MNTPHEVHPTLREYATSFLIDRKANGLAVKSIAFYSDYLNQFVTHCEACGVHEVESVTPDLLRAFLLMYAERHNAGGCHAVFRSVRAFLRWYESEYEPPNFKNPLKKVKPPKVPTEPLTPVSLEDVSTLLETCKRSRKIDARDYAILLTLIDTGLRANELLSLTVDDVNLATGEMLVKQCKGKKPRTVFAGQRTRKALRAYVRVRREGVLFLTRSSEGLGITGLRAIVKRRAKLAGIDAPSLHSFRRGFAINCLRAGMDIFSLQRLMGHSDLSVLRRYLNQTNDDLQAAHRTASPADKLQLSHGGLASALFGAVGVPVEK